MIGSAIRFFQEGGLFMYIILFALSAGVAIAVERFIFLNRAAKASRDLWEKVTQSVQRGQIDEALNATSQSKAVIGSILSYGLIRVKNKEGRRGDIEIAMEEGLMEVIPTIEKRTHYIATLANVTMLLGLLGTVAGLIEAFGAVAHAEPSQKAELLSAAIAVGMNATAFGLGSAIPLMLVFSFLQSKTGQLVNQLEMASVKFLNLLSSAEKGAE